MVDFVEELPINFCNLRITEDDFFKELIPPGYNLSDVLDPKVMSFKELIPLLSTDDCYCVVRIKVEGSGWLKDEPVLGRFAYAALHKFNQESGTQYKFRRIYKSSAALGEGDTWFRINFVVTDAAGCSTEMFQAFVTWNFQDDVEEVHTVKSLYKFEIEDFVEERSKEEEQIALHNELVELVELVDLSEEERFERLEEERLTQLFAQFDYSNPKDMEIFYKEVDAKQARDDAKRAREGVTNTIEEPTCCGISRVKVRGSGSFDDDPFLGEFCLAAIDEFNRVHLRHCKFAKALEATAQGCGNTLFSITFEATTEAGYTETFKAEVYRYIPDELEVVNVECQAHSLSSMCDSARAPPSLAADESKSQNEGSPTMKEKELESSERGYCYAAEGAGAGAGANAVPVQVI